MNTFEECGYKYKIKYIDKIETETIYSSLYFGSALDTTFNELLLATKENRPITYEQLVILFDKAYRYYQQRDVEEIIDVSDYDKADYYKGEFKPDSLLAGQIMDVFERYKIAPQQATWERHRKAYNLVCYYSNYNIGIGIIKTYQEEILPALLQRFEIISIQEELKVDNGVGDIFTAILDFTARERATGDMYIMDNKSASITSFKREYKDNCVQESQQLSLYAEFKGFKKAGYVVYQKTLLENGRVPWKIITGDIIEVTVELVFTKFENLLDEIQKKIYDKNEKSCWSYGRKCPYFDFCKKGKIDGLYKREEKNEK